MARTSPIGTVTRGTTNPNRLRRCDRWLAGPQAWRLRSAAASPIAVDLGYGASPVTAVELHERLSAVRPDVRVVGIEIEPSRVELGRPLEVPGLSFRLGGFEVPLDGESATVVRAFNVLRQYSEEEVPDAWRRLCSRLTPDGLLVDGTCDEIGRLASWATLDRSGPLSLTCSWHLRGLVRPGVVAERLPKALIHRNVPGERVHDWLSAVDAEWARQAPLASYGARQRFVAVARGLREAGWPLLDGPARWRLGELTVAWSAVAPS
ncbi:class I SAM-dependent methyltransferase [Arsenicicoccus bolidensis]|uniref:class I SAM-dependent methyltransferase n=1 Tax=Arsenicicoccus bolidensis TaxID=229480 RepID=UPI00041936C1|nr:class I SAM-dependent methyltransferase [Arsenicicoccus bolidensis]